MAVVAGLLGASRTGAGLHYPTDVAAGAALGALVGNVLKG
jgi:membrane-associated phospholipid phosphatase